ncbi:MULTISPECIES: DUF2778 domain-containing protein [Enterobacterales]|uniref:DUF2778 domain-containing protein n=1 Tax=Raoultella planticola TaxID=575 RepID=A0A443VHJ7_RAOPL|nr:MULTISPECIES: DUF2778 domain-containing protein [Enterobacterales]EKU8634882.1 DUF2778 domain-containing protein [Raoultella ornithinolytica]ELT0603365.1 DUF2778 domain-containing protein [Raoultella ornithinolytica]ELT0734155.1 DUF2778 domain-containing protein [Raoultella ornithinolytica]MBX4664241.1 hypothetical protein [Klebsiella michiganensis]MDU2719130.1 DUF2778 domain-containing protein [Klebsiella michiganensis]
MTLHGRFVINDAHDSPLSFAGAGTFLAFSGDGIYRNRGACDMKPTAGPVPAGKYWIVNRPEGGLRSHVNAGVRDRYNQVMNGATFRHRRDDWGIDDDTWNEGVKRGNFRLHPGALSKEGITLLHASDFAMLHNALLKTPQVDVPCMSKLKAYGTIEVILTLHLRTAFVS